MYVTLIQPRLNPGIKKIHGIRDQVLQQFWDQGSKFKAQMWDQSAKNIPCYDPEYLDKIMLGHRIHSFHRFLTAYQKIGKLSKLFRIAIVYLSPVP